MHNELTVASVMCSCIASSRVVMICLQYSHWKSTAVLAIHHFTIIIKQNNIGLLKFGSQRLDYTQTINTFVHTMQIEIKL